jgi:type I restriction enzyme S subunit
LISRFGLSKNCVRLLNSKFYLNDSGLTIQSNDTNYILDKYLAYYLYTHQSIIYNIARGTAQKNLDIEKFKELEIPIPSIEKQQEIVNYCKNNDKLIKKLEQEIETNKEQAELFIKSIVKLQANPLEETDLEDTLDSEQE